MQLKLDARFCYHQQSHLADMYLIGCTDDTIPAGRSLDVPITSFREFISEVYVETVLLSR